MKKVLFVATVVKKHIMVFHLPYLKWFKESGYEVHVCAKNDYDIKEECQIPFCDQHYDLPFERSPFKLNNIKVYIQLKEIIESNQYDIIHCHTPMGGALTRLAASSSRKNGTKVIYTAHGFHFYKGAPLLNWILYYPIERLMARFTDILITLNREDYERAKKSFKAEKVEYIYGVGIDNEKISKVNLCESEKRRALGISKNAFILLSVGEINKNKNHEIVIKVLSRLKNNDIYYIICGNGPLEKYLKKLSKQLGVENNVRFLGHRNDVTEIYRISDVFIFPSYREGLSVSLMEAMSASLPVVCSNIRGNSDLVKEGKGGYLYDPTDIEGFSSSVNKLYKSIELRNKFGSENLARVHKYSLKCVMEKMKYIYVK